MENDITIQICFMKQSHLHEVAEIEKLSFSTPWSEQSFSDTLSDEKYIYLVALHNEKVVGYCGIYYVLDEADITNIAVLEEYRGRGIGEQLIKCIISKCLEKECTSLFLEVRKSNISALGLYKKAGFTEIGIRKDFYEKPNEDAILMRLNIEKNSHLD